MHHARVLGGAPTVPRRSRAWLLLAWAAPWLWARMWDGAAQKEAWRVGGAFVHLGPVRLVIHLPDGSYAVPWRHVQAEREGQTWPIEAAGVAFSVVDEHLSARERRRLRSSISPV